MKVAKKAHDWQVIDAVNTNDQLRPFSHPVTVKAAYTASSYNLILVDCTGGAVTVSLPSAVNNAMSYTIKKIDATGNAVTVDAQGSQTIDGSLTSSLITQWQSVTIASTGSNWVKV